MLEVPPALELRHVSKTFPGQVALDDVDLVVERSEVHALVGHNGSGKSTLIKVLAGFHTPESGSGAVAGVPVRLGDSDAVRRLGVRFIHQGLGLLNDLTVLENLRLGRGTYRTGLGWRIQWRHERGRARELLEQVGIGDVSPDQYVRDLSAIQKTGVAICRALDDEENASVFVFDEPTATLPDDEVERLFAVIRRLAAEGIGVVYVSHRLEEIYAVADRVTVLREGEVIAEGPVSELPRDELVALITGAAEDGSAKGRSRAEVRRTSSVSSSEATAPALELSDIVSDECAGLSLTVHGGEVLGVAGLAGSGVNNIPEVLLGQSRLHSGTVRVLGSPVIGLGPRRLRELGVAVLPADTEQKAIMSMSVGENVSLCSLSRYYRRGWFRHGSEYADVLDDLRRFGVRPARPNMTLALLSGGNRQKACVAKWLRTSPRVLVLDEPLQGVDIGGKQEIVDILKEAAYHHGVAVVVCSSDLDDLESMAGRVLVVRRGRVTDELRGREITRHEILQRSYAD
jgi:ribose transport system ATP-binding protein